MSNNIITIINSMMSIVSREGESTVGAGAIVVSITILDVAILIQWMNQTMFLKSII